MKIKNWVLGAAAIVGLAGCSGSFEVAYEEGISGSVTRNWDVVGVNVFTPRELTVSNRNSLAPNADIVWHGEPFGDRRAQVAAIVEDGIEAGTASMNGDQSVTISATVVHFHAVTPQAVSRAPRAVHNIRFAIRAFDSATGEPLTPLEVISADLEAYTGAAAVAAAVEGQTQRVRIVDHIARVTRGWLGQGPDMRRRFSSVGR